MRINIEVTKTKDSYNVLRKVPVARREVELKKRNTNFVRDMWDMSQVTAKKYYNTYRKKIFFAIKDKIFINVKNLRLRKLCKKLTDRYIGSFKMSKFVGIIIIIILQ
jgi:hypothetical protein